MLGGYRAAVDWPAASFWPELSAAFPDALVLLSVREPDAWWRSAHATILSDDSQRWPRHSGWKEMWNDMVSRRFTSRLQDREACIEAYNRHNERVRETVPPDRLVEWSPGDGWEPLCRGLGLPLPDLPFPHANSRSEYLAWLRGR